jgi:mono/diheme cytochrome c family protein
VVFAAILLLGGLGALALTWRPPIREIARPAASSFAPDLVARGAGLARIGDCTVCHTTAHGAPFAGGLAIPTPFGSIYSTNITPDEQTGIGRWSEAAFTRAMRHGLRRDGAQLYPAFPYDHFRSVNDADLHAIYAFLMTRRPVHAEAASNHLIFPLGFRPFVAGWKLVALKPAPSPPTGHDDEWRRGAYLVQGLGHCGACHTPHGKLGGERTAQALDGGTAEGWYSPPLNAKSPAATPWTVDRVYIFLRTGFDPSHAAAAGPMGPVTRDLAGAPDADVHAIAVYIADQMSAAPAAKRGAVAAVDRAEQAAREHPVGATLFAGACASCHEAGAPMMLQGRPPLQLGSPLHEDTPRNTILMIDQGLQPPLGRSGPYMPSFAGAFTQDQTAELVAYVRERFSDRPSWPDLKSAVAKARKETAR